MSTIDKKAIDRNMVFLNQEISTQREAFDVVIRQAKKLGLIKESTPFLQAVIKREQEESTAVGYQVAIPHGKSIVVKHPFIGFIQVKNEFRWNESDEDKVKLIFLIGVPEKNHAHTHLKFISQLSKKLLDDDFRNTLLEIQSVDKVYQTLNILNEDI